MTFRFLALSAAFALTAVPMGSAALSAEAQIQPTGAQIAQAPQGQPQGQLNEQAVTAYALAALDVTQIQGELVAQMEQAQNAEQADQLREQATIQMIEAIEAQGLSVEQFNQVNAAVAQDPGLQEVVQQIQSQAQ